MLVPSFTYVIHFVVADRAYTRIRLRVLAEDPDGRQSMSHGSLGSRRNNNTVETGSTEHMLHNTMPQ